MRTTAQRLGGIADVDRLLDGINEFLHNIGEMADWGKLSESEYVDRVLSFASAPASKESSELVDVYFELVSGSSLPPEERGTASIDAAGLLKAQAQLIEWLEIVRTGRQSAVQNLRGVVTEAGRRIVIKPDFVEQHGKLRAEYRFFPADLEAAFGYVLLLILDDERNYSICRCKYAECLRYFLEAEPENGRPRRVYCSPEHLAAARKAGSAERMRKRRSKMRREPRPTRRLRK